MCDGATLSVSNSETSPSLKKTKSEIGQWLIYIMSNKLKLLRTGQWYGYRRWDRGTTVVYSDLRVYTCTACRKLNSLQIVSYILSEYSNKPKVELLSVL